MNSIRALQNFVRRSFAIKPKATQSPAGQSSAKTARAAQASADNSSATSISAARGTASPPTSRPTTASSADRPSVQNEHGGSSDTSSANNERPKLQPKHHKDRRRLSTAQYTRPDYAARVVFEEFDDPNDPMPEGYAGTLGNIRFSHAVFEDYMPCGAGGGHFLTCGHAVVSVDKACGTNCKTEMHEVQPFNCPQCQEIVKDVLDNSLTLEEKAKIDFFRTEEDGLSLALAVEYVTKRLPIGQCNITETVAGIISPQYGRQCLTVRLEAKKPSNLAEIFREEHSTMEEKTRARLAEEKSGSLKTPEKRKSFEEPAEMPDTPEAGPSQAGERVKKQKKKIATHSEPVTEQTRGIKRTADYHEELTDEETSGDNSSPAENTSVSDRSKKQKQKLQTHSEPVSEQTRGMKRVAELPDEETSSDSPSPSANTSKKLKTQLETHRLPITIRTRGEKRKSPNVEISGKSPRATKRIMTSIMPNFGGVAYLPTPPSGHWYAPILPQTPENVPPLGQLERKRLQDM